MCTASLLHIGPMQLGPTEGTNTIIQHTNNNGQISSRLTASHSVSSPSLALFYYLFPLSVFSSCLLLPLPPPPPPVAVPGLSFLFLLVLFLSLCIEHFFYQCLMCVCLSLCVSVYLSLSLYVFCCVVECLSDAGITEGSCS